MMKMILAIAAGGAFGAVSRHYFAAFIMRLAGGSFPLGIMVTNIVGSLCMGLVVALLAHRMSLPTEMKSFLTVGFLGAFTTFSTFSMEAVMLCERGAYAQAALYIGGSVLLGILGFISGLQLGKMV